MSLSWGRAPRYTDRPSQLARGALITAALAAVLASGAVPALGKVPSIIEPDSRRQIQETLDQHVDAIAKQDLFVYDRTLDRRDEAYVTCMRTLFRLGDARVALLKPLRITRLTQVGSNLVEAVVEQRDRAATIYIRRLSVVHILTRPPFDIRRVFHVWYLTPLAPDELGEGRGRDPAWC